MTIRRIRRGLIALGVLCLGALAVRPMGVGASDHNEPQSSNAIAPGTLSDAGDIYGNFAFPTDDSVVLILTFPAPPYGWGYLPGPDNPQVVEVTPEKKVVWQFKDFERFGNSTPVAVVLDGEGKPLK